MKNYSGKDITRYCHNCGKPMIVKEKLSGEDKGSKFWVCSGYNQCKTFTKYYDQEKEKPSAKVKISAGKKPKILAQWKSGGENSPTSKALLLVFAILITWAALSQADLTYLVFKDTSKVTDPYFIPMDKPAATDPQAEANQPQQENQNHQQPVMEHISQERVNNGDFYQYRDKNGNIAFTDNRVSIPREAEAKNWNGTATGGKFEVLKGQGRETKIVAERDRVYVPVKIRSAGVERELLLLLDTGATSLVVYQDAVPGIRMNNIRNGSATLANGSQVQQLAGTVDLVSVGPAVARDFEVRIMQQVGQKDHQGLLGMSFLKNFHYTLDMNRKVIRWN